MPLMTVNQYCILATNVILLENDQNWNKLVCGKELGFYLTEVIYIYEYVVGKKIYSLILGKEVLYIDPLLGN